MRIPGERVSERPLDSFDNIRRRAKPEGLRIADVQVSNGPPTPFQCFRGLHDVANCISKVRSSLSRNDHWFALAVIAILLPPLAFAQLSA